MNYLSHYVRLIERAKVRALEGYSERHHVLPRCMGGSNESTNLVRLTAEEHFIAHQLLVKIHPDIKSLAHAAKMMACTRAGNKLYGWLKRRHAKALSGQQWNRGRIHTAETRAKYSFRLRGRIASQETRDKMSLAHRGNKYAVGSKGGVGRKHTPETRAKISEVLTGRSLRPRTKEEKAKISSGNMATKSRPENYRSAFLSSPEYAKKQSEIMSGIWALRKAGALPSPIHRSPERR